MTAATSPLEGVKLHLVTSIDDLWEMKRWAGERRETPLAFDTETTGLSPEKDELRLVQLGDKHHGWAVPWHLWGGGAIELLSSYEDRLVAHNRSFDLRFLELHAGWKPRWEKIDDTLTMAHLVDPLRPRGLKPLADRLVDRRASAGEQILHDGMKKQGWTWATVPIEFKPYWIYGAADPVLTAHIWDKLHEQVEASYAEAYDFEQAASRICARMMLRGMKIDVPYVREKIASITRYSREVRGWLSENYAIESPMGHIKIARALEKLGQEIVWHTENGQAQLDKEALRWYAANGNPEVSQLVETILTIRHAEKMMGTYFENLLKLRDHDDVVHASIWPLGARTGRMSITDPALQTLPRDDLMVRGSFIPRDGYVLISCDYDQVEARLAAHFSHDAGLIAAFAEADGGGEDFFCGIAGQIFGTKIIKGDRRRALTKNVCYGSIYGAGAPKMAITAGVTLEVMRPVKERFDQNFPGLKALSARINEEARRTTPPSILTPLGRRLVADQGREYTQMTNALIQGHAAEILKQAMINLDAAGLGDAMLLPVHDELVFEVPEIEQYAAMNVIRESMQNHEDYLVPITCEPSVMTERWTGKG